MPFIMSVDSFVALIGLTIATAITPGPNNAMVAASGAHFGYRRTLPHILGISLGFGFMIFCVGIFLGEIFQQSKLLREILRWAGVGLLIYVAWRTATAHQIGSQDAGRQPQSNGSTQKAGPCPLRSLRSSSSSNFLRIAR